MMGRSSKPVQLADPSQGVGNALLFGFELRLILNLLPRAAAAVIYVGTRRRLTQGRGLQQANRLAEGIISFRIGHPSADFIPRNRGGNHNDLMIDAADTVGTVGERFDL